MSIETHNLQEQYIALGAEGAAVIVPGGDAFWRSLGTANDRSGADDPNSRIVMSFTYEGDWSQWEMHPAGDEVLRRIGAVLRRTLRSQDHIARYGGEEFAVLLVGQTKAQAICVARKLRKAVKALEIETPQGSVIRLTASFGIAGGSLLPWEDIVRRADLALYAGKEAGRDRQ